MKVCSVCKKENTDEGNYCVYCGGKLVKKRNSTKKQETTKVDEVINKKNSKTTIILVIIIIILVIALIATIVVTLPSKANKDTEIKRLNKQVSILKKERDRLFSENTSVKADLQRAKSKNDFYDNNIVFVLDGYGRYYYTYDQVLQVTQGTNYTYWAYNTEQAKSLGYVAWNQ